MVAILLGPFGLLISKLRYRLDQIVYPSTLANKSAACKSYPVQRFYGLQIQVELLYYVRV
jgi:hypothetical protein